jgi:hypothetical protein
MALFASFAAAEARAYAKMADQTWQIAYPILDGPGGQPSVRFLRWMSFTGDNQPLTDVTAGTFDKMNQIGAWDQTNDDAVT